MSLASFRTVLVVRRVAGTEGLPRAAIGPATTAAKERPAGTAGAAAEVVGPEGATAEPTRTEREEEAAVLGDAQHSQGAGEAGPEAEALACSRSRPS